MDYLYCFNNIPHTPGWYYKEFPGFYSLDSYKILASWTGGCRTQEHYFKDLEASNENDRKRKREENKNDDISVEDCIVIDTDDIHAEFEREHAEDHPVLGNEDEGDLESSAV